MNDVFVLVAKERTFDAVPVILTAVDSTDLTPMYDLAKAYSNEDNIDIMCRTYFNGDLMEISVYNKHTGDFEKMVEF